MTRHSRLPIFSTLVTFLAVVIMFALGLWQLQRADEKKQRLMAIEQAAVSAPLTLSAAKELQKAARDYPIQLSGLADEQRYFLLDNKIQQGKVGYEVVVPVTTLQGRVLVNFGWVAAPRLRAELPDVQLPIIEDEYSGRVSIPLNNSLIKETARFNQQWPKVMQQMDIALMAQHYQQDFLPFVVLLDPQENVPYLRNWQPVVMPPEKHVAYAIQWFLLAFAALITFVFAQRRKITRETQ
ncbi:MAG: SURF1 family protein [Paraglaciecola sp.]|uniref:SURF1 family protein n=1 Tax=Paraglaciecola sp. TaxID=1920173 RepID=UPI00273F3C9D|nr:SURF1 family protein [Paraglaciecola sp.]MDP5029849.1 SURF1 family protein [Paraglaciecola sp.]MDP5041454.1 SURF1 family protein [Paraglaciecola sp.]MDP5130969.1 SURF1 family protein [Paraglaciecola sp.]